jgi:hypothetical protein
MCTCLGDGNDVIERVIDLRNSDMILVLKSSTRLLKDYTSHLQVSQCPYPHHVVTHIYIPPNTPHTKPSSRHKRP